MIVISSDSVQAYHAHCWMLVCSTGHACRVRVGATHSKRDVRRLEIEVEVMLIVHRIVMHADTCDGDVQSHVTLSTLL